MNERIFRKVSLERLSSPEQLDSLIKVASMKGWLAFTGLALLIVMGILWGVFGSLPTKFQAGGVLITPGGPQPVYASYGGRITDISVRDRDEVKRGDVIARIEQPELLLQLELLGRQLEALNIPEAKGNESDSGVDARRQELKQAYERLRTDYMNATRVVSPYSGRILEILATRNAVVQSGNAIVTIEAAADNKKSLEAVLYVPVEMGKQVKPGMEVRLSPTTVNKQEYGFMLGRVSSVSEYPVTQQGMMQALGNEALVRQFAPSGAVLEIHADLVTDAASPSSYKWSTRLGPPVKIESGTFVSAEIVLSKERPIHMVIPIREAGAEP